ncbi:MAG: HK97 gp10 family phage protein [Pseudomonadota bacterium]
MTSSFLEGGAKFRRALKRLPEHARKEVADDLMVSARDVQVIAISLVPMRTGNLATLLASPRAIGKREKGMRVEFGFRTAALRRDGWYAHFVEHGTKGYSAGDVRLSGVSRSGLGRYKKVNRDVPARPAQPFIRPAFQLLLPRHKARMKAAVRRAVKKASRGG